MPAAFMSKLAIFLKVVPQLRNRLVKADAGKDWERWDRKASGTTAFPYLGSTKL